MVTYTLGLIYLLKLTLTPVKVKITDSIMRKLCLKMLHTCRDLPKNRSSTKSHAGLILGGPIFRKLQCFKYYRYVFYHFQYGPILE